MWCYFFSLKNKKIKTIGAITNIRAAVLASPLKSKFVLPTTSNIAATITRIAKAINLTTTLTILDLVRRASTSSSFSLTSLSISACLTLTSFLYSASLIRASSTFR